MVDPIEFLTGCLVVGIVVGVFAHITMVRR
jgi:hypothetical protein